MYLLCLFILCKACEYSDTIFLRNFPLSYEEVLLMKN